MRAEDVMSSRVCTCGPGDTLDKAAGLMWRYAVGLVPVVDEDRRLLGVLTDRDVAMAAWLGGRRLSELSVRSCLTTDVATCSPGDDLAFVEETMPARRVRRLPVVDGEGRVVGVVSLHDLAAHLMERHGAGVSAAELARTLRSVGARRRSA